MGELWAPGSAQQGQDDALGTLSPGPGRPGLRSPQPRLSPVEQVPASRRAKASACAGSELRRRLPGQLPFLARPSPPSPGALCK